MAVTIDLHTHSRHGSSDGSCSYDEIAEECSEKGIDIAVITEHDAITKPEDLTQISDRHGVLLLPGIEITFVNWGHFVILGGENFIKNHVLNGFEKKSVKKVFERIIDRIDSNHSEYIEYGLFMEAMSEIRRLFSDNQLTAYDFLYAARTDGAYIIWAHPFNKTPLRSAFDLFLSLGNELSMQKFASYIKKQHHDIVDVISVVDSIEGLNGRTQTLLNYLAQKFGQTLQIPLTAGSDGHRKGEFGRAFMNISCSRNEIFNVESLINVLKSYDWRVEDLKTYF